ncbi:MAG: TonB family protein [Smithella sp.]
MNSKKVIFWPAIVSIIFHLALISASSVIDLRDKVKTKEIFTVNIKETPQDKPLEEKFPKEEKKKEVKKPAESRETNVTKNVRSGLKEDTVNLGSQDIKYVAYLDKIKRKILQIWEYPAKAYEKNEEGVAVIKMSLDARGNVITVNLVTSSGSVILDEGALGIVKAASPFEPLPYNYGLERLHIVASFRYKLEE